MFWYENKNLKNLEDILLEISYLNIFCNIGIKKKKNINVK